MRVRTRLTARAMGAEQQRRGTHKIVRHRERSATWAETDDKDAEGVDSPSSNWPTASRSEHKTYRTVVRGG